MENVTLDPWVQALLGAVLIFAGRRLFWLFVATVGFFFVFSLTIEQWHDPRWALAAAVAFGILGAIVAVFVQKAAVIVAGLLVGAWTSLWLLELYEVSPGTLQWFVIAAAALLAALLAGWLFEIGLIVLSSAVGAVLITDAVRLDSNASLALFLVLTVVGIAVQSGRRKKKDD